MFPSCNQLRGQLNGWSGLLVGQSRRPQGRRLFCRMKLQEQSVNRSNKVIFHFTIRWIHCLRISKTSFGSMGKTLSRCVPTQSSPKTEISNLIDDEYSTFPENSKKSKNSKRIKNKSSESSDTVTAKNEVKIQLFFLKRRNIFKIWKPASSVPQGTWTPFLFIKNKNFSYSSSTSSTTASCSASASSLESPNKMPSP